FLFARSMRDAGFLDCYTLISCFHQDVYLQFADLVKRQPAKVRQYFEMLINWENRRYDKYRHKASVKKSGKKKNKS
ncbi:MAG TPA: hypothetical protein PLP14_11060, partial [Chitinophagaceae bacterium]|nr:hypothetical protein [Chitinophagaceae bacterium]